MNLDQIDGTGQGDSGADWQTLLNDSPAQTEIVLPHAARYRHERTIVNAKGHRLIGDHSQQFFMTTTTGGLADPKLQRVRSNFDVLDGYAPTMRYFTIKGANPFAGTDDRAYVLKYEAQHCVNVLRSDTPIIEGMTLTAPFGDFLYFGGGYDGKQPVKCARVRSNTMYANGRQGCTIKGVDGFLFESNHMSAMRRACFDMELDDTLRRNRGVTLRGNEINWHRLLFLSVGQFPSPLAAEISDLRIEDNWGKSFFTMEFVAGPGHRRGPIYVNRNRSTLDVGFGAPSGRLWLFENIDGVESIDNVMPLQPGRGMRLAVAKNCTNVHESGNQSPGGNPAFAIV